MCFSFIVRGITVRARSPRPRPYNYGPPGQPWSSFNLVWSSVSASGGVVSPAVSTFEAIGSEYNILHRFRDATITAVPRGNRTAD